jgi:hypothetical protein
MSNENNFKPSRLFILLLISLFLVIGSHGLLAQNRDSLFVPTDSSPFLLHNDSAKKISLNLKALVLPGSMVIYGALKPLVKGIENIDENIYKKIETNHPYFYTNSEDYLMWAPSASIYILDAFKVKTEHHFKEHLMVEACSIIITGGIGFAMRLISKPITEYNTHNTEFPSGHTANAFRGAEILHHELQDRYPLLSYSGYVVAASVGVLRIYNKDHLLTQVLAGAGLGMLSTKLTYWIFNKVKFKKK